MLLNFTNFIVLLVCFRNLLHSTKWRRNISFFFHHSIFILDRIKEIFLIDRIHKWWVSIVPLIKRHFRLSYFSRLLPLPSGFKVFENNLPILQGNVNRLPSLNLLFSLILDSYITSFINYHWYHPYILVCIFLFHVVSWKFVDVDWLLCGLSEKFFWIFDIGRI